MSPVAAVAIDASIWAVWGTVVGRAAARARPPAFTRDGALTRGRPWELALWERLGARRLARRLPDAGGLFGVPKRAFAARGREGLEGLATETRRAEVVHWTVLAAAPLMMLWSPAVVVAVMFSYAAVANVPCIVVQRYNRARVARALSRRAAVVEGR